MVDQDLKRKFGDFVGQRKSRRLISKWFFGDFTG